jgi:hypothetical protein
MLEFSANLPEIVAVPPWSNGLASNCFVASVRAPPSRWTKSRVVFQIMGEIDRQGLPVSCGDNSRRHEARPDQEGHAPIEDKEEHRV